MLLPLMAPWKRSKAEAFWIHLNLELGHSTTRSTTTVSTLPTLSRDRRRPCLCFLQSMVAAPSSYWPILPPKHSPSPGSVLAAVTAAAAPAAAAAAEAASTTTAGAKPSQWLVGTELATQQEVDEGKEKAEQTGYPPLPKDLAYIRFKKGKGFHVQCCACQVVIGFAKLGGDGKLSCDDDGNCPHWNPDSKRKLEEEAHRMHNEWATARRR